MINLETNDVIPAEILADTEAIITHLTSGKPLDADLVRRVRERAERISAELRQKQGILDIGVPAIRELRDAE